MTNLTEIRDRQRALLLAIESSRADWEASLDELARLAETAGVEIVGRVTQKLSRPDSVYFLGKGKAHEIRQIAGDADAECCSWMPT
jgi:GTP-binding protein HflX